MTSLIERMAKAIDDAAIIAIDSSGDPFIENAAEVVRVALRVARDNPDMNAVLYVSRETGLRASSIDLAWMGLLDRALAP